jgi:ribA/ribD-fused uncharacterized protein
MITFTKADLPYGCLGNMSPYAVTFQGKRFRTAEALFQALRFEDEQVREAIRTASSPMVAKMIAKKYKSLMVVVPTSDQDLANMRLVLRLKHDQQPEVRRILRATRDHEIIEDCSKRNRGSAQFWGAALVGGKWQGLSWLGRLWMELRAATQAEQLAIAPRDALPPAAVD